MKAKSIIFALILLTITFLTPQKTQAQEQASASSATFNDLLVKRAHDYRVPILKAYLEKFNSPLAPYANIFVEQADLYHLDWKFVVAISGAESTFGKAVPCTNAWGWGIYTNHMYCFNSYDEAIRIITRDLRQKYVDAWGAHDVWSIGHLYAASPTWASHVSYFMNDIQNYYDTSLASMNAQTLTLQ